MEKRNKIFDKPFDTGHWIMFNEFPGEYIQTIGVPGRFVKKINRRVHLKDGTGGLMDSAFILDPDGEILTERVAACLEHQTSVVKTYKLEKFGDFDVQLVADEHLPTFLIVASHLNPDKSERELIRSPSDISKLYFLNLREENIYKRLNRVSSIIENNEYLSAECALNLGVIALYAPREHACEITEKVAKLYVDIIDDLDFKMAYCLYSVISIMIDAYFEDKKEYERLINMVNGTTPQECKEAFAETKAYLKDNIKWAKEDIARMNEEIKKLKEENSRIPELEAEINRLNAKLNGK